jgi:hypothetical protein
MHQTTVLELCLPLYLNYDSCLCIELYELNGCCSLIRLTFQPILVDPMARDRSLVMARCSCRSWYMAKRLEDHVAAIGSLNLNLGTFGRSWLNWRPSGALR